MASVPIDSRVDVIVSLGTQPISTASFNSALFLADLETGGEGASGFSELYRVYSSLDGLLADNFQTTSPTYKVAELCFGGNFRVKELYVVNINAATTAGNYVAALGEFFDQNSTPYYIMAETRSIPTVTSLASYADSKGKMFVTATDSADVLNPSNSNDVGSILQDASFDHAITLYSTSSDIHAEGGIVGAMAAIEAGTSTLEDKTMVGVPVDQLNDTQRSACEAKNVAYYAPIAGVNSVFNSKVASGQFFDTIVFSDWVKARLSEEIYGLLKRESDLGRKVSYDEAGFAKIRQACNRVIEVGKARGSISLDTKAVVRLPTRDEVSEADRMNRVLPNLVVEIPYSNAVHKVVVRAYVTV